MDYGQAILAEKIAQKLAKEDGRDFPTTIFHNKAYEILMSDQSADYLSANDYDEVEKLPDQEAALEHMTKDVKEFEELTPHMQKDILNSGLMSV